MSNWDEWMKLGPLQRRKAVAADILGAIAAKKLKASQYYAMLDDHDKICASCAIGAVIMSQHNYCTNEKCQAFYRQSDYGTCIGAMVSAGFTTDQAKHIESVFEGRNYTMRGNKSVLLKYEIPDRDARLVAVWQAIHDSPDVMLNGYIPDYKY